MYFCHPVILLDEYMSALDATTKDIVFTSLLGPHILLRKNSKTFILGTRALYHLSSTGHNIVSAA
jgi:ATP-binding cassette subfamily C (CFTR/MRP) protein 1